MIKITDRSLYRKLQVVIEEAGKGQVSSPKELAHALINKKGENVCFTYYRLRQGERKATPVPCHPEIFTRTVNLAIFLGLIDENSGQLTKAGIKALNRDQFSPVLRQKVKAVLTAQGVPFDKILEIVEEILRNTKLGEVSSCDAIYERLLDLYGEELKIERKRFHILLTLLSYTGGIAFSQKKIFLPYTPK